MDFVNFFPRVILPLVQELNIPTLTVRQKKVAAIAMVMIGLLTTSYLAFRRCFKGKSIQANEIVSKSLPQFFHTNRQIELQNKPLAPSTPIGEQVNMEKEEEEEVNFENVHKSFVQILSDEEEIVQDPRYYPPMLSAKEQKVMSLKASELTKALTFGKCSLPSPVAEKAPPIIPLEERKNLDYRGSIKILNNRDGGFIGCKAANWHPQFCHYFERTDGVDWRQFPGDMFISVQFSQVQKKGFLGWREMKGNLNLGFAGSAFLPTQLFYGKEKGDTVEFLYKGKCYAFQIDQDNPVEFDLTMLAHRVGNTGRAFFSLFSKEQLTNENQHLYDPYIYRSHLLIKSDQYQQMCRELLSVKFPTVLENLHLAKPISIKQPLQVLKDELGSSIYHYSFANFAAYEKEGYRCFTVEMPCVRNFWVVKNEKILAIVGPKDHPYAGNFPNHLFALDFQNDGRLPEQNLLEDVEWKNGMLYFKVKIEGMDSLSVK